MTDSPIMVAVALAWITGHFGLYVACRLRGGSLGKWQDVLSFHLVSAAGLGAVIAGLSVLAWSANAAMAAATALALHGVYSLAMLESWPLLEASLALAGAERTAYRGAVGEITFLDRIDGLMRRSARLLAIAAFIALFAAVAWYLLLRPIYAASFIEYYMKYLPFLTDHGLRGILDLAALGDPRPRLLPLLGAVVNVDLRRALLLLGPMHPSFGIAWLIYPAALVALYWAVYLLCGRRTPAVIATLLYAASPGHLDILVDYYIPAKPLVNLFFITALVGVGLSEPHALLNRRPRPLLGTSILFLSALGGVLSDETAVFLISTAGILALPRLLDRSAGAVRRLAAPAALVAALLIYVSIGFFALPAIAERHGYAVVPLGVVMLRGVYAAMFGTEQPLGAFLHGIHSGSLLETIVSAHTVLGRAVVGDWTYNRPPRPFWDASAREYGQQLAVLIAFAALLLSVSRAQRRLLWSLVLAFALFVYGQAVMIYPLAPYLVEVNYYAGLSSIFVALLVGLLLGDFAERKGCLPLAGLAAAWLAFTSFSNFLATAQRHPGFTDAPLTWTDLREARARALAGQLLDMPGAAGSPDGLPHRGRKYLYALEVAMARQHARGERVDIQPLQPLASAPLYRSLHLETLFDTKIPRLAQPGPATLAEARGSAGATAAALGVASLQGRRLRGSTAEWNVDITIAENGVVRGTVWRPGLMRLWGMTGRLARGTEGDCLVFDQAPALCMATLVTLKDGLSAYDAGGRWVLAFHYVR
ncbi:MAG: hypothetical protein ACLQME_11410 [Alphaproteobacteria bacterium]